MRKDTKIQPRKILSDPDLARDPGDTAEDEHAELIRDSRVDQDPPAEGPEARDPAMPPPEMDMEEPAIETEDENESSAELVREGVDHADDDQRETARETPADVPGEPRARRS